MTRVSRIQKKLLTWYRRQGRDLLWRHTRNPYAILVSEVMLQQTQVDRVIPKYRAWLRRWPTAQSLAQASVRDVLSVWSGLGYNRRAMYLRDAAKKVVNEFGGQWPRDRTTLKTLPGVGEYTAGAVMVFAQRQPVSMIDTNVRRVINRLQNGTQPVNEKLLAKTAARMVPTTAPDEWHHALMDLGATVCVSAKPRCDVCPLQQECQAYPKIFTQVTIRAQRREPAVRFESTDRFWRGRIIARLIGASFSTAELRQHLRRHGDLSLIRFTKLIRALRQEGLIQSTAGRLSLME